MSAKSYLLAGKSDTGREAAVATNPPPIAQPPGRTGAPGVVGMRAVKVPRASSPLRPAADSTSQTMEISLTSNPRKPRGYQVLSAASFAENSTFEWIPKANRRSSSRTISSCTAAESGTAGSTSIPTPARAKKIDFSEPYFKVQVGVLAKKDENVTSFDQLRKKRIFVIKHSPIHNFLRKAGFRKNLNFCASSAKCYRAFKRAKNAVHVDDNLILHAYAIIDNKSQVALDGLGKQTYNAIAVQKGNNALLELINKSLAGLKKDGFLDKTFDDTLGIFYHGTIDKKEFLVE